MFHKCSPKKIPCSDAIVYEIEIKPGAVLRTVLPRDSVRMGETVAGWGVLKLKTGNEFHCFDKPPISYVLTATETANTNRLTVSENKAHRVMMPCQWIDGTRQFPMECANGQFVGPMAAAGTEINTDDRATTTVGLPCGTHVFQFDLCVPPENPPSFKVSEYFHLTWKLGYVIDDHGRGGPAEEINLLTITVVPPVTGQVSSSSMSSSSMQQEAVLEHQMLWLDRLVSVRIPGGSSSLAVGAGASPLLVKVNVRGNSNKNNKSPASTEFMLSVALKYEVKVFECAHKNATKCRSNNLTPTFSGQLTLESDEAQLTATLPVDSARFFPTAERKTVSTEVFIEVRLHDMGLIDGDDAVIRCPVQLSSSVAPSLFPRLASTLTLRRGAVPNENDYRAAMKGIVEQQRQSEVVKKSRAQTMSWLLQEQSAQVFGGLPPVIVTPRQAKWGALCVRLVSLHRLPMLMRPLVRVSLLDDDGKPVCKADSLVANSRLRDAQFGRDAQFFFVGGVAVECDLLLRVYNLGSFGIKKHIGSVRLPWAVLASLSVTPLDESSQFRFDDDDDDGHLERRFNLPLGSKGSLPWSNFDLATSIGDSIITFTLRRILPYTPFPTPSSSPSSTKKTPSPMPGKKKKKKANRS